VSNDVFILAGQSNMVGLNAGAAPVYANAARIFRKEQPWDAVNMMPINTSNPAWGPWALAVDPIHSQPMSRVGPGMAMADRYLTVKNDSDLNVGLVPCGWSGSKINAEWTRTLHCGLAYPHMLARTLDAQSWGTVRCMVWYQGESEAQGWGGYPYPLYMESLCELIERLRQRIGIRDLPVIITRLGPRPATTAYPYWPDMQLFQSYAANVDPKIKVVDASDLTTVDGMHLDIASQVTLGRRYADCLVGMQLGNV
jgi:hypothetical protein